MIHHNTPQSEIDDTAFPIRIKIAPPAQGLGHTLDAALRWLQEEVGPGEYAQHATTTLGGDALAIYFRRIEHALDFLSAFPELDLADSTKSRPKTSPMQPRDRTK